MVDKVALINRITKAKTSDVIHSSGYAKVQNGENMGANDSRSFEQRRAIDEQRKFVRGYNNSKIMNSTYKYDRVKSYIPRTSAVAGDVNNSAENTVEANSGVITVGDGQRRSIGLSVNDTNSPESNARARFERTTGINRTNTEVGSGISSRFNSTGNKSQYGSRSGVSGQRGISGGVSKATNIAMARSKMGTSRMASRPVSGPRGLR